MDRARCTRPLSAVLAKHRPLFFQREIRGICAVFRKKHGWKNSRTTPILSETTGENKQTSQHDAKNSQTTFLLSRDLVCIPQKSNAGASNKKQIPIFVAFGRFQKANSGSTWRSSRLALKLADGCNQHIHYNITPTCHSSTPPTSTNVSPMNHFLLMFRQPKDILTSNIALSFHWNNPLKCFHQQPQHHQHSTITSR